MIRNGDGSPPILSLNCFSYCFPARGMSARKVALINIMIKTSTEPLDQDDVDELATIDESELERICSMSPEEFDKMLKVMDQQTEVMEKLLEEHEELLRRIRAVDEQVKKIADRRRQQQNKPLHTTHRDAGTSERKLFRWPVLWKFHWK